MRRFRLLLRLFPLLGLLLMAGAPLRAQNQDRRAGVVIDYGDGRGVQVCVDLPADRAVTALDVLRDAGRTVLFEAQSLGPAICKVDDVGCAFPAQTCFCQCQSPSGGNCRFWSRSKVEDGKWQFAASGAGEVVQPGAIEGWTWGLGSGSTGPTPIALLTFDEICTPLDATATPTLTPTAVTPIVVIGATTAPTPITPTAQTALPTVLLTATPSPRIATPLPSVTARPALTNAPSVTLPAVATPPTRVLPTPLNPVATVTAAAATALPPTVVAAQPTAAPQFVTDLPLPPSATPSSPTPLVVADVPTEIVSGEARAVLPLVENPLRVSVEPASATVPPAATAPGRLPTPVPAATPPAASDNQRWAGYLAFLGLALALGGALALLRRRR